MMFVIASRMVNFVTGSMNLILVCYSSSFKRDLVLMYPMTVPSHLRPRFAYVLGSYEHARKPRRASARRDEVPLVSVAVSPG